jgi:hypothetical protein
VTGSTGTGPVSVGSGAVIGGTGTIAGPLTLSSGSLVSPGTSPGTIFVTDVLAEGGSTIDWELLNATGTPGTDWDFLSGSGTFTLAGSVSAANPVVVNAVTLSSITPDDVPGPALNFNPEESYSWVLGTFTGGIIGFQPGFITVNGAGFANTYDTERGSFSVRQDGTSLYVDYTYIAPLQVKGVFVRGSSWANDYLDLAPFTTVTTGEVTDRLGWALVGGADQLANSSSVTWSNVNQISVQFSAAIDTPAANALKLVQRTASGVGQNTVITDTEILSTAVTMLAGNTVALFTVPTLTTGKYWLSLQSDAITSPTAGELDGEWATGATTFSAGSGDGAAGGVFNFRFNVLVGDVNADGVVNNGDINAMRLTTSVTTGTFRYDLNGSNSITNAGDRNIVSAANRTFLERISEAGFDAPADQGLQGRVSANAWAWFALENNSLSAKKR